MPRSGLAPGRPVLPPAPPGPAAPRRRRLLPWNKYSYNYIVTSMECTAHPGGQTELRGSRDPAEAPTLRPGGSSRMGELSGSGAARCAAFANAGEQLEDLLAILRQLAVA